MASASRLVGTCTISYIPQYSTLVVIRATIHAISPVCVCLVASIRLTAQRFQALVNVLHLFVVHVADIGHHVCDLVQQLIAFPHLC